MKTTKIISVCKTDCDLKVILKKGKVLYHKVTKASWGMYVEVETLLNGKKRSVTRHGKLPKRG